MASTNLTSQLLEYGLSSQSLKEHVTILNMLNWKTATHYGMPPVGASVNTGDIAGHVTEIFNQLRSLVDKFLIGGNRSTAQQVVQLLVSTHELGVQCLPEEEVSGITQQLMNCLLHNLERLHQCSSSGVVYWYLVLLSRLHMRCDADLAGPCLATLVRIIAELQKRKEPLQQLLQSRYGFTGRPFEAQLFSLEPSSKTNGNGATNGNIASSFAALNQLVSSAGDKEKMQSHLDTLGLKRCFDLLDVEPLPFTLLTASDGTRLERADAGSSQFTAVALNGLVEASKLGHNKEVNLNKF